MPILNDQQMARAERNSRAVTVLDSNGAVKQAGSGIPWKEASNQAEAFARASLCKGFAVDKVPMSVQRYSEEHPVRVFSVGPWPQRIMMGTLGTFTIPACKDGETYAEMTKYDPETGKHVPALGGLVFEALRGDGQMPIRQHDSHEIAEAILGIGAFQNPQNALTKYGCFISECGSNETPSAQELAKANKALRDYLHSMIIDVRKAYADGKVSEFRSSDHFLAARILKLNPANEPWMKDMVVETNDACPGCGTPFKKGVAVCRECRTILDEEKYKTLKRAV